MAGQSYHHDAQAIFHDATAMTTVGDNAGSLASFDFGGAVVEAGTELVIDVRVVDFGDADETYLFEFQVSNDSFSTNIVVQEVSVVTEGGTAGVGRWHLPIKNQIAGVTFNEGRLNVVGGGTTPSIEAFVFLTGKP